MTIVEQLEAQLEIVSRICAGKYATDRDLQRKASLGRRIRDEKAKGERP